MAIFSGSRQWVYPQFINGTFYKLRWWVSVALHLFLLVVPWIQIGGNPAVRIDLPGRRVYLIGQVFTAADGFFIALLGLFAAFMLFFATALLGRVFCGYVCPQTILLTSWVRPIEKFFEGDRAERKRRDAGPWTFDKIRRKGGKWATFALASLFVSMAFGQWFAGAWELWTLQAGPIDYALVGIFSLVWFGDFAWFREQACNYLCPYARFQGALTDRHSLIISYDVPRGEPRTKGKAQGHKGGCIDCNKCVVVCPQGIDIRDGFQLECIACGLCIDACTTVMGKFDHPTLVRYSTEARDQGQTTKLLRPRTVVYAALLTAIGGIMLAMLVVHSPLEAQIARAAGTHYALDHDGFVRNTYMLRVANNATNGAPTDYTVAVEGLDDVQVQYQSITLAPSESRTVPIIVRLPVDRAPTNAPIHFVIASEQDRVRLAANFAGPGDGQRAHQGY
jgi:cytochrome c oxidase accessory protein FixG